MIGPARCCCLPVHEDVSVAGEELAAAEADVEVVVVAVELVGVVAGVAEHAPRPPRRGRRLQRGGGVAGEAGLEVAVGVHGDGIVVRHSLGGLIGPVCLGELVICFLLSGWEKGSDGVRGRREGGALYFGGRCGRVAGHLTFWPLCSLLKFRSGPSHL